MSEQSNNRVVTPPPTDSTSEDGIDIARGDTQIYGATAPAPSSPSSSAAASNRESEGDGDASQPRSIVAFGDKQIDLSKMRDSYIGEVVSGRFKIVEFIDRGGMGEVYLGLNESVGQKVAVKFLNKKFTADEGLVVRFGNEARSYARVTHPNAVTLLDYGQHDDGALYIITEFVDGKSLSKTIKEHGLFSPEQVISIGQQCCDVLTAAHDEGVIHRDLKPDNLMLMPGPKDRFMVKVLDFGIAKISDDETGPMTETGAIFGTPEFMSPEQARGDSAQPQSDLYALGIILYYMATGRLPFSGKNKFAVLNKHLNDPPPRPNEIAPHAEVPPALEAVILKCLNKEASERYASAEDLYEALDDVRDQLGTSRTTSKPPGIKSKPPGTDIESDTNKETRPSQPEQASDALALDSDVVVDAAVKPVVNLGEGLKFDSQVGLEKEIEVEDSDPVPLALGAEIDLGAERPTDNLGSNAGVDAPVDWEEDFEEFDAGPSPMRRLLAFVLIAGVIVVAAVFGPKLLDRQPTVNPDGDGSNNGNQTTVTAGEDVSTGELDQILMTGQVLGLLSSAEEHLQAGDIERTRKNLATAALWMEEGALPAPAREKRVELEKALAKLDTLEARASSHAKAKECLPLRKTIPEIDAISPARAKHWLGRADACQPARDEKATGTKDTGSKSNTSDKPKDPPNNAGGKGDKPGTDSSKTNNETSSNTSSEKPEDSGKQTTPAESDKKDPPSETTPEDIGLPPKTL